MEAREEVVQSRRFWIVTLTLSEMQLWKHSLATFLSELWGVFIN